jgi:hypothetical protein
MKEVLQRYKDLLIWTSYSTLSWGSF